MLMELEEEVNTHVKEEMEGEGRDSRREESGKNWLRRHDIYS